MKGKNATIKFILIIIAIAIAYRISRGIGIAVFALALLYIVYDSRATIFSVIAGVKYNKNLKEEAFKLYKKAYDTNKASTRFVVTYGYLLLREGDIEAADKILKPLLKEKEIKSADKGLVKSNYALILWKKGMLEEAIKLLEETMGEYKTSTNYGSLGYLYILKGDLEKALQFNLEAYDYNSSNSIILDNLAQTYFLCKEYDKAEKIYEKLISKNPTFPEAYYTYGLVLLEKNKKEQALEYINKSLNYNMSFLSTLSKEEIENKIKELKSEN